MHEHDYISNNLLSMYVHMYIHFIPFVNVRMYMYILRIYVYTYAHVHMYMYTYMYVIYVRNICTYVRS